MNPLRLHATLIGLYVLVGLLVTAADGPLLAGAFLNLSGVLPPLYWKLAGAVALLSSLAMLFARGRNAFVRRAHTGAFLIVAVCVGLLALYRSYEPALESRRNAEEAKKVEALGRTAADSCARLEAWGWEERPRGTLHLFLDLERRRTGLIQINVKDPDRLARIADQPMPAGAAGQHVTTELVIPRTEPEPFTILAISFLCPNFMVTYSNRWDREIADEFHVERPLPPPYRSGSATGVLQGYDLIVSWQGRSPRFLLRAASNLSSPRLGAAQWLHVGELQASLNKLPPRQTIVFWRQHSGGYDVDAPVVEAMVTRAGHKLVELMDAPLPL